MRARLDVAVARRQAALLAKAVDLARSSRLFGRVEVGVDLHQDPDGPLLLGPNLVLELPIFDQRQAIIARLEAQRREQERRLAGVAIDARSEIRVADLRVRARRQAVLHYRDVVLPLRKRISDQALLYYNGMFTSFTSSWPSTRRMRTPDVATWRRCANTGSRGRSSRAPSAERCPTRRVSHPVPAPLPLSKEVILAREDKNHESNETVALSRRALLWAGTVGGVALEGARAAGAADVPGASRPRSHSAAGREDLARTSAACRLVGRAATTCPSLFPTGRSCAGKVVEGVKVFHMVAEEVIMSWRQVSRHGSGATTAGSTDQ